MPGRVGWGAVRELGGLLKLLQSFTKRLLQSDDFLAREGGGAVREIGGLQIQYWVLGTVYWVHNRYHFKKHLGV